MKKEPVENRQNDTDVPYNPNDETETLAFWKGAISHTGLDELKAKLQQVKKSKDQPGTSDQN